MMVLKLLIAKYNKIMQASLISCLILFDARRFFIKPRVNLKILMFEAYDTSTDLGVIPDEGTQNNPKRENLEWIIIKPKNATHKGYREPHIKPNVKNVIFSAIKWFMNELI